jgi:hypothetical protein
MNSHKYPGTVIGIGNDFVSLKLDSRHELIATFGKYIGKIYVYAHNTPKRVFWSGDKLDVL